MPKKKLIEVIDTKAPKGGYKEDAYGSTKPSFALVSSPKQGRVQVMNPVSCRDFISDAMHYHFHLIKKTAKKIAPFSSGYYRYEEGGPTIDMEKFRLLIIGNVDRKERVFSGKRAITLYEELAGWKNRSKITTVKHPVTKSKTKSSWLLTGPKEWMTTTHMVSVVTLIIRIAYAYGPLDTENLDTLEKQFETISNLNDMGDSTYLKPCWNKFRTIVTRYKEIFDVPPEKLYPENVSIHSSGGVVSLCKLNTNLGSLDENFRKILKEEAKI
jgi:hypothetical protein